MTEYTGNLNKLYRSFIEFWGVERQARMLQEECGEAIAAVSHWLRKREDGEAEIIEELADVYLMANQMREALGPEKVDQMIRIKAQKAYEKLERYKRKTKHED